MWQSKKKKPKDMSNVWLYELRNAAHDLRQAEPQIAEDIISAVNDLETAGIEPKPRSSGKLPPYEERLQNGRRVAQELSDYWQRRIRNGDPLFDQFMVDQKDAARAILSALDSLETKGLNTGQKTVTSSLPSGPRNVKAQVNSSDIYLGGGRFELIVDGSTSIIDFRERLDLKTSEDVLNLAKDTISRRWDDVDFSGTEFTVILDN